jgi:hypothetical protein
MNVSISFLSGVALQFPSLIVNIYVVHQNNDKMLIYSCSHSLLCSIRKFVLNICVGYARAIILCDELLGWRGSNRYTFRALTFDAKGQITEWIKSWSVPSI